MIPLDNSGCKTPLEELAHPMTVAMCENQAAQESEAYCASLAVLRIRDLVGYIFSFLPINSFLSARCVCKEWYAALQGTSTIVFEASSNLQFRDILWDVNDRPFPKRRSFDSRTQHSITDYIKTSGAFTRELKEAKKKQKRIVYRVAEGNLSDSVIHYVPPALMECSGIKTLDLSRNWLRALPSTFATLTRLVSLDLADNEFEDFPDIGALQRLQTLDLSDNHIRSIPNGILGGLTQLQTLSLSNNGLQRFPTDIVKLTALTELFAQHNALTRLPKHIGHLTALQKLNLQFNQLQKLPCSIGQLTHLQQLGLCGNALTSLPTSLGDLSELIILTLANNHITHLPYTIGNLVSLKRLTLGSNDLKELPATISQLEQLHWLEVEENALSSLPDHFNRLKHLEVLILANNNFVMLPQSITKLRELRQLYLQNNVLKMPINLSGLKQLTTLNLSRIPLSALPKGFGKLPLKRLVLCSMTLGPILPKEVRQQLEKCKTLVELHLQDNGLTDLPPTFKRLKNLRVLNLSKNAFTFIPEAIAFLSNLQELNMSHNLLQIDAETELDTKGLGNLKVINLSYNKISRLPRNVLLPSLLEELYLDHNEIDWIDGDKISKLRELRVLSLGWNELRFIPNKLKYMKLEKLITEGNPISSVAQGVEDRKCRVM